MTSDCIIQTFGLDVKVPRRKETLLLQRVSRVESLCRCGFTMSKNLKSTGGLSKLQKQHSVAKEIRTGILIKSPPNRCKTENSWKKRYFALNQLNGQEHQLVYYRSADETDKPVGEIDLTHISVLQLAPQSHDKWLWIEKKFRCAPSCVLHIKSGERDYFLVGQNSEEMDGWFTDLYEALKSKAHQIHIPEEVSRNNKVEVISKPLFRSSSNTVLFKKWSIKSRSFSDPPSKSLDADSDLPKEEDMIKRRASVPGNVEEYYVHPRPLLGSNDGGICSDEGSGESLYETMGNFLINMQAAGECDHEVEKLTQASLNQPVSDGGGKNRIRSFTVPLCAEGKTSDDRKDKGPSSRFSFGSSDSGIISPVDMQEGKYVHKLDDQCSSPGAIIIMEEKDIEVNQAELKKHLTITDLDGRPSVSGWTALPETVCLFHKGDQILAINDLHTSSKEEFDMYLSKSLKNEVKVTILRPRGCRHVHSCNCICSE